MTVRTSVTGIFSYMSPFTRSLVAALWPWVPVIWRMVVLKTEITETKEGFTTAWLLLEAGKRGTTGMDASQRRGRVLSVV